MPLPSPRLWRRTRNADAPSSFPMPPHIRRRIPPALILVMLLAFIAGVLVVQSVVRHQVHCDDGSVWVMSQSHGKAVRFNADIEEPTGAVRAMKGRFDVLQSGDDALLAGSTHIASIDAPTLNITDYDVSTRNSIMLLGGGTVAMVSRRSGDLHTGSLERIGELAKASGTPVMRLGTGGKAVVDHKGTVWGYRPSDGTVLSFTRSDRRAASVCSLSGGERLAVSAFTVVDGVPVVLSGNRLVFPGGETTIDDSGRMLLQSTPTDDRQSGWVAIALPGKLALISLRTQSPEPVLLDSLGSGAPAQPVSAGGCVHAAFAQHTDNAVQACSPSAEHADFISLASVTPSSELVFRANHRHVVLNDVANGTIWNPQRSPETIALQWNALQPDRDQQREDSSTALEAKQSVTPDCDSSSSSTGHIRAVDDEFGIRPSSRMTLDVLRNDESTGCSALRIDRIGAPTGGAVRITPVRHGRYLQVDASELPSGTIRFTYSISDGHGQSASASVRLNVAEANRNQPPVQTDVPADIPVERGASYTASVLDSFTDPDGDPLTLVSAKPQNSGTRLSARADGRLTFDAGTVESGRIGVELTVSDGTAATTGIVFFAIHAADSLGAQIDPISQDAISAVPVTVDLSPYIHATGTHTPLLTDVTAPENTSATANGSDMTVSFAAASPGTYHVPFTVRQGRQQSAGIIRFNVSPPATERSTPITTNDVVVLGANGTAILEPLSNDLDPMGGVLSLASASAPPDTTIRTTVVARNRVHLEARHPLDAPITITYTAVNAVGTSQGSIIVHPASTVSGPALIRAEDFTVPVRCGGTRTVDVLSHIRYDEDAGMTLEGRLNTTASFQGMVHASELSIRYQAPDRPGEYSAVYTVGNDYGETVSATVTFAVHQRDADGKKPPKPRDIQTRVAPGGTVRIPIALGGVDDADDVMLLGLGNETPARGRIVETGADYMIYEAYTDANGTDSFSYAVEDWSGRKSQATIRVGISAASSPSGVTARDDDVTVRPGSTLAVPVTANDLSHDGANLTLLRKLEVHGRIDARATGSAITFTASEHEGTYYIIYTVRNQAGLEDTATLSVQVSRTARIRPPQAYDHRIAAHTTLGKRKMTVNIADRIANPSGPFSELSVHMDDAARRQAHGSVQGTVITLELAQEAYTIPYTVTNTVHGLSSTAFIHVPAYGAFPPTLRPDAPELTAPSGKTITFALTDYVRVGAGKTAYADSREPIATAKGGDGIALDGGKTIRFTAPNDYAGPASIALTATDADPRSGKPGASATIMVPVTVTGGRQSLPTFPTTTIDMAPGDTDRLIDLHALTVSTRHRESSERFTYSGGLTSQAIQATVSNTGQLRIRVADEASPGATVSIPIRIHAGTDTVEAGLSVRIVASSRPLARIAERTIRLHAGATQHVNILADAYNPFPGTPLTVTQCTGTATGTATGESVTIRCDESGDIAVRAINGSGSYDVAVTVADATRAKDRMVTGILHVATTDVPDAPSLSIMRAQSQDGAVTLVWNPGRNNGAEILEYEVHATGHNTVSCGTDTVCTIDGLSNGRQYTFTVRARNDIGWSAYSNTVTATPDAPPGTPLRLQATGGRNALHVTWQPPSGSGTAFSAPTSYTVTLTGSDGSRHEQQIEADALQASFQISDAMLSASLSFTVGVRAANAVGSGNQASLTVNAGEVYGIPDRPVITMRQDASDPNIIRGSIALGEMRGNSCTSITVNGHALSREPTCTSTSFAFDIADGEFFSQLSINATVETNHGLQMRSESASVTPVTPIGRAEFANADGSDAVCTMRWRITGKADSVMAQLHGMTSSRKTGVLEYTPAPWTPCETGTVTALLNGESGATMIGPADLSMNKPAANITPPTSIRWDGRNHIIVRGGRIDTYGQPATIRLLINAVPFVWEPSAAQRIDVSSLPDAASYRWTVHVTANGGDHRLDAVHESTGNLVEGARAVIPSSMPAMLRSRRDTNSEHAIAPSNNHYSGDTYELRTYSR